jgi:plastocyanin
MPGAPAAAPGMTLSFAAQTGTLRLNETKDFTVTVTATGGLTGSASLTVTNLPAGVTGKLNPASVTLGASPVSATLTLTAAPDMTSAASMPIKVSVAAGSVTADGTLGLAVPAELLVTIPKGVNTSTMNLTAFGAASFPMVYVAAGTKVTFLNNDTIAHRVHADGTDGFNHEANNLAPGATYTETLTGNATTTIPFRCHIHPNMVGQIVLK